jgi:hypothetical protein
VDPRAGLDDSEKRNFFALPGLELLPLIVQPVASRYTDCAIRALPAYYFSVWALAYLHETIPTIPTERPPLVGEVSANFCG